MEIKLSTEEQQAIAATGALEGDSYVVFSREAYQHLVGIDDPEAFADSVAKANTGIAESQAGLSRSVEASRADFDKRHGIQR
jgi:hypothetical protein